MSIPFVIPRARFFDRDANPLSNGRVSFYEAGTSTLKEVYLSNEETSGNEAQNPHVLNSAGQVVDGGIWLGTDPYKVVVESFIGRDNSGTPVYETFWTMDNIPGSGVTVDNVLGSAILTVVQELRNLAGGEFDVIYTLGHSTVNDNGGGWFKWDADNTSSDDNGAFIEPLGSPATGRWVRIFENAEVRPEMWGGFPDRSDLTLDGNFQNMILFAQNNSSHSTINISSGDWYINGDLAFDGDITVYVNGVAVFQNLLGTLATISFTCADAFINQMVPVVTASDQSGSYTDLTFNPVNKDRPALAEWWGTTVLIPNDITITSMINGTTSGRALVFSNGEYEILSNQDFTDRTLRIESGSKLTFKDDSFIISDYDFIGSGPFIELKGTTSFTWPSLTVPIRYFDIKSDALNIDTIKYDELVTRVSLNGIVDIMFEWEEGEYYFNGGLTSTWGRLSHIITGADIRFVADTGFGRIVSCRAGAITTAGFGVPTIDNTDINPEWFGAVSNTDNVAVVTVNSLAIEYAMRVATVFSALPKSKQYVNGDGAYYYILNGIELSDPTAFLGFKNISIQSTLDASPVLFDLGNYMVAAEVLNFESINSSFSWNNPSETTTIALGIKGNGDFTDSSFNNVVEKVGLNNYSSEDCNIHNCYFTGQKHASISSTSVFVSSSRFTGSITVDSVDSLAISCLFGSITNNQFRYAQLTLLSSTNVKIQTNQFISNDNVRSGINLAAQSLDERVNQLCIINNVFSYVDIIFVGSAYDTVLLVETSGNFDDTGHHVTIKDNTVDSAFGAYFETGTELPLIYDVTVAGDKTLELTAPAGLILYETVRPRLIQSHITYTAPDAFNPFGVTTTLYEIINPFVVLPDFDFILGILPDTDIDDTYNLIIQSSEI